ncbi:MAG: HDOD domain-containing protein [Desulfobulbaceae bacterium]|uniref:HDOD domain-containing protein n=1 Tax=Candidatus Desulfobia pelagia TaxID=2841692 RepID=A0A8J6NCP5_9BACT|nr:HDOD domain-containing protein [Candidatus Desulfobia pelagia]
MSESTRKQSGKLAEIFAKINMSDLPAMSTHVKEILDLTSNKKYLKHEHLTKIVLQDYSLTNKVLQFANSAYYSPGQKVSTVSMAVAILGFDTVRDLCLAIALFDDFIQAGVEKEAISKLLIRSFLSAMLAREIVSTRFIRILPEEAFICSLMRNLGKMVACIYFPALFQDIEQEVTASGISEDDAARSVLDGMTFSELGVELAKFWNLTDTVIASMDTDPQKPESEDDEVGYLKCMADFSNRFVEGLCGHNNLEPLLQKYGEVLLIDEDDAIEILEDTAEASSVIFDSIRFGLQELEECRRKDEEPRSEKEIAAEGPSGINEESIQEYSLKLTQTLMAPFKLEHFFSLLAEALWKGVGFDRVVLSMLKVQGSEKYIKGLIGRGEMDSEGVKNFQHPVTRAEYAVVQALKGCKDMVVPENTPGAFPDELQDFVRSRTVYLFPICLRKKGIALLYMDKKSDQPALTKKQVKYTRMFRDLAVKALMKKDKTQ